MAEVNAGYELQLDKIGKGRYSIKCVRQAGRNELIDKIIRFEEEIWVKEHITNDIEDYRCFEVCHRSRSGKFQPILFHTPYGYSMQGFVKSHGLRDAILWQGFESEKTLKLEVFTFNEINAMSDLYLQLMVGGCFEGELGMIQAELLTSNNCGIE